MSVSLDQCYFWNGYYRPRIRREKDGVASNINFPGSVSCAAGEEDEPMF